MAEPKEENPFQTLWRWYTAGTNVWNVAVSSGATLVVVWAFPADWKTPKPWLLVVFVFSATWGLLQLIRGILRGLRRWWNPPTLTVDAYGGKKATLRLLHKGPPTTYSADGRIATLLSNSVLNPAEQWFRCEMQFKGTDGSWETTLQDGDWAHIVMAAKADGPGILVRRGRFGAQTTIPDAGATLEYEIRSRPALKAGRIIKKTAAITRVGDSLIANLEQESVS